MSKTYTGYRNGVAVYRNATKEQVEQSHKYPAQVGVQWVEDASNDLPSDLPEYAQTAEPTRTKKAKADKVDPTDEAEQGA